MPFCPGPPLCRADAPLLPRPPPCSWATSCTRACLTWRWRSWLSLPCEFGAVRRLLWRTRRLCNHSCCPLTSINNVHSVLASDACHLIPPLPLHTHTPPPHPPTTALRVASRCTNRPTHPAPPPFPAATCLPRCCPPRASLCLTRRSCRSAPRAPCRTPASPSWSPRCGHHQGWLQAGNGKEAER